VLVPDTEHLGLWIDDVAIGFNGRRWPSYDEYLMEPGDAGTKIKGAGQVAGGGEISWDEVDDDASDDDSLLKVPDLKLPELPDVKIPKVDLPSASLPRRPF
jgi:hypothetical protein